MPTISIDVPAAATDRVMAAILGLYPPPAEVPVGTAAEKLAYVRSILATYLKGLVREHERNQALAQAIADVETALPADVPVT